MRTLALAAAVAIAPLAACAPLQQATQPLQTALALVEGVSLDTAKPAAGAYNMDSTHTSVTWRIGHLGVSLYTARFDRVSGDLTYDPVDPTRSSVRVAVDVASVSTGLRNAQGELAFDKKIGEALGAVANPTARFVSTSLTRTGPTSGRMIGNLSLNGVTKPVTLNVTFGGGRTHPFNNKPLVGFSANGSFKRSEFGVTNWLPNVADEVQLLIETEFVKAD
jgi:polyisoprenoid-binding protein YceI